MFLCLFIRIHRRIGHVHTLRCRSLIYTSHRPREYTQEKNLRIWSTQLDLLRRILRNLVEKLKLIDFLGFQFFEENQGQMNL